MATENPTKFLAKNSFECIEEKLDQIYAVAVACVDRVEATPNEDDRDLGLLALLKIIRSMAGDARDRYIVEDYFNLDVASSNSSGPM